MTACRIAASALLTLALAFALASCPTLTSFKAYCSSHYGQEREVQEPYPFVVSDRSYDFVAKKYDYHNYLIFSYARVKQNRTLSSKKQTKQKARVYLHRYVGVAGVWLSLPYFPIARNGQLGVGICLQGQCLCWPAPKGGCLPSQWEKGTLVTLIIISNLAGLLVFHLNSWASFVFKHCHLSLYNLGFGRFSCLFLSTFLNESLFTVLTKCSILLTVTELLEERGDDWLLLLLYFGGALGYWVGWLTGHAIFRPLETQFVQLRTFGSQGSFSAIFAFLYHVAPASTRISISPFGVGSIPLRITQCAILHALADACLQYDYCTLVGHVQAFVIGSALTKLF
eukprot:gb/GEZN01008616.1/.p1 GENE.gb/GEZN01008616.1/~~gb/GEZN01008616.1/.p1  ORF type:complete len:354 (+),score=16.84 gb/GEZN01008616.1/:44-1063(+)